MDETKKLGTEKIFKLILKYSIPSIVGILINAIYNIVDRIFIGQSAKLGSIGIGATTITFPIYVLIMGVGLLFGSGGSILFSTYLGEKKENEAKKILAVSTSLLIISSLLLTVFGLIFLDPILRFFGADGLMYEYSKQYISVILIGAIFQNIALGLNNFVRADGHPKTSMVTMLLGAIINIILDPIFIYVFDMGMTGAAIATILGQLCSSIWVITHFTSKRCTYRIEPKLMKPDFKNFKLIIEYGLSAFILQVAGSLVAIVLNKELVIYGGDIAVSGMGIINTITTLLVLPVIGITQGATPIISYNNGAGNKKRIIQTVKICMVMATVIMVLAFIIVNLFPHLIISTFNNEPELINFTTNAIRIYYLAVCVVGIQVVGANYFQSVGKYKISIFLNMCRQILILIPLILIFAKIWGLDGILYACPLSDFLAFVLTFGFVIYEYRKNYVGIKNNQEEKENLKLENE